MSFTDIETETNMVRNVHIGKVITGTLADREVSIESLATKIDMPENILSLMLKNDDLGCNVLFKISKALEYDFFGYYSFHLNHTISAYKILQNKLKKEMETIG
jgi:hypothetical protein